VRHKDSIVFRDRIGESQPSVHRRFGKRSFRKAMDFAHRCRCGIARNAV